MGDIALEIIKQILEQIDKIPLLSQNAMLLLDTINDPKHTIRDILKIIERDNILSIKVLRLVNSSTFGLNKEITSLERAITYLGKNNIVNIALSSYSNNLFEGALDGYESEDGVLWLHCLQTAIAAKELARFSINKVDSNVSYICGLLHDLGKAVLSGYLMKFRDKEQEIIEKIDRHVLNDFADAERELLGTDHAEVGYYIAKHWNLPRVFLNVIRYHHEPSKAPEDLREICFIIHLGDMISMLSGLGTGTDNLEYRIDKNYKNYIDFTEDEFENIFLHITDEFNKINNSLEML